MATWKRASMLQIRAVEDIMATLRRAGANIKDLEQSRVGQTLDQGQRVLEDDALWARLPERIEGYSKGEIRASLRSELDACR